MEKSKERSKKKRKGECIEEGLFILDTGSKKVTEKDFFLPHAHDLSVSEISGLPHKDSI